MEALGMVDLCYSSCLAPMTVANTHATTAAESQCFQNCAGKMREAQTLVQAFTNHERELEVAALRAAAQKAMK